MLKRFCASPRCQQVVDVGERYCQEHKDAEKAKEKARGTSAERGYDHKWRAARKRYLREHYLCVECVKKGKYIEATEVDHIKPHRGDKKLFWAKENWQPLCESCHSTKTAKYDGGFGNGS